MFSPAFSSCFFVLSLFGLNLDWCFFLHSVDSRNPKTNLEPEWTFHRGKGSSRKNNKSKNKRDLNGFKDPSFPLRLVKEKMCHLDVFGLNLDWWPYFVSPYAPPAQALLPQPACPPGVVVEPTTETKREPNEFNSWGHQLQQRSPSNCHMCLSFASCCSFHLFLSLLIFVVLSCRWLFPPRCQVFCPVRLTLKVVRRTWNPTHIEQ